jgi:hypothetical protein
LGVFADALLEYGKPLLEGTEGSSELRSTALKMIQLCWNISLEPDSEREAILKETLTSLDLPRDQKAALAKLLPAMVERHKAMFPALHPQGGGMGSVSSPASRPPARPQRVLPPRVEKYPGTGRNEPCPCGSGKKYKRCCAASQ